MEVFSSNEPSVTQASNTSGNTKQPAADTPAARPPTPPFSAALLKNMPARSTMLSQGGSSRRRPSDFAPAVLRCVSSQKRLPPASYKLLAAMLFVQRFAPHTSL